MLNPLVTARPHRAGSEPIRAHGRHEVHRLANSRMAIGHMEEGVGLGCTVNGKHPPSFNHSFLGLVSVPRVLC